MKTQSFRFHGGVVRIAAWHGRADVASLALRGRGTLAPASVDRLLERVRAAGYREVVTNALAPAATLPLVDAGFAVRGRLRVLAHDLRAAPRRRPDGRAGPGAANGTCCWRPTRRRSTSSGRSTATACARPRARLRARSSGSPATRVRSGTRCSVARHTDGYVQRLAVHPDVAGPGRGRGAAHRRPAVVAQARRDAARTSTRSPTTTAPTRCTSASGSRRCPSGSVSSDARCDARPRAARRRPRRCSPSRVAVPADECAARSRGRTAVRLARPARVDPRTR